MYKKDTTCALIFRSNRDKEDVNYERVGPNNS